MPASAHQSLPGTGTTYPALSQPGRIGRLVLPHRILMGSMHMGLEGKPEELERLTAFYVERARGGAALIITGGVTVEVHGGADNMYCLTDRADVEALSVLPKAVHAAGGRIALQLFHSGRYARSDEIGGRQPVAPSAVPSRLSREVPRALTEEEIQDIVHYFAEGAKVAMEIGFDAVEVMGSEGYLLNEFLSPLTNRREDGYGGSLEGRMRISLEVVAAIRSLVGSDFPVIFRMSGLDCMPGSTTEAETLRFAEALETTGVDALNIGIGWHESRVPTVAQTVPRGAFAPIAAAIKRAVQIPVLGANRINTPETAESVIAHGYLDFIASARPWLADASLANKMIQGDRRGLNVCIACNQSCLDHTLVQPHRPVSCLVNPRAGYELDKPMAQAAVKKQVAVVGAGVAGLEAARTAAVRGHHVTLFEQHNEIGGQFRFAARVPGKEEFYETLQYFSEMLRRYDVDVRLGTRPTADMLAEFDEVIIAQGVRPSIPDVPGVHLPHVATYVDVLTGAVPAQTKIAIVGAGGIGCDTAHFLAKGSLPRPDIADFFAHQGLPKLEPLARDITILARSRRVAGGIGPTTKWVVRADLQRLGIKIKTDYHIEEIVPEGIRGMTEAGPVLIEADQIILCTGQIPNQELIEQLRERTRVHVVGGAKDSQGVNAARAIREAFETAYAL